MVILMLLVFLVGKFILERTTLDVMYTVLGEMKKHPIFPV